MVTKAGPSKCGAPPESHQPILVKEWTGPASLSEVVQLWLVKKRWMFTPWKIQTWTVTRTDRCTLSQSFSPDGDKPQERACGTYENDTCYLGHELKASEARNTGRCWCTLFDSLVCLASGFRSRIRSTFSNPPHADTYHRVPSPFRPTSTSSLSMSTPSKTSSAG